MPAPRSSRKRIVRPRRTFRSIKTSIYCVSPTDSRFFLGRRVAVTGALGQRPVTRLPSMCVLGARLALWSNADYYRGTLEPFSLPRHFVFSLFGKIPTEFESFTKLI